MRIMRSIGCQWLPIFALVVASPCFCCESVCVSRQAGARKGNEKAGKENKIFSLSLFCGGKIFFFLQRTKSMINASCVCARALVGCRAAAGGGQPRDCRATLEWAACMGAATTATIAATPAARAQVSDI